MLKGILTGILSAAALSVFACWGTIENYDKNFIYSVNNYVRTNLATMAYPATFANGGNVSFPATVNVKINPLATGNPITKAVLQYRVGETGPYTTAVTINNPQWTLSYDTPRPVFGQEVLQLSPLPSAGTRVYIRLYLTDDIYETFDLESEDTELGAFCCYVVSTGRSVPQLTTLVAQVDVGGKTNYLPLASMLFTDGEMK